MLRLIPRLREEKPGPLLDAGLPPQLARVLWARGVQTAAEAEAFLSPDVSSLHDPMLLHGMEAAVERIRQAVAGGERIVIYGDYDVDGVCASAILVEALEANGANVGWYIPSRHREGYGLNPDAVKALAEDTALLVTVDCGITSLAEAALARELGMDMIITDHHEHLERLPEAVAVVNPLLGAYPFRRLCGAGVAFKLVWALYGQEAVESLWELAALATVADLVPLLGENRVIVSEGLRRMQHTRRPGLRALVSVSGMEGKTITAGHLGFQIAPRINAGGRLHEASRNVELLVTRDADAANRIAADLNAENAQRQRMEQDILGKADAWVQAHMDFLRERVIVVVGSGWNTGVVGLAASRLVEKYAWPTVVLSQDEEGIVRGSARSVPGVNIHMALSRCSDLFTHFGGHAQAAGMTLAAEDVPELRRRLNAAIEEIAEPDAFVPSALYDLDITLGEVTIPLIEQLDRLAPTGFGNPAPVFRLTGARVLEARNVGVEGKHLKLRLEQSGVALDGIAFGQGEIRSGLPEAVDVLFSPSVNEYMGRRSAQCEVARILPHAPLDAFLEACAARQDDFDCYLLECLPALAGQEDALPTDLAARRALVTAALEASPQGTLLTVRTLEGARGWLAWLREAGLADRVDYCFHSPPDRRRFNTLCALPDADAAAGFAQTLWLDRDEVLRAAAAWLPTDDGLRDLYRALRAAQGRYPTERALAEASGLRVAAVRLGLRAFAELELVAYTQAPFSVALLPPNKCSLDDSDILRRIRTAAAQKEGL